MARVCAGTLDEQQLEKKKTNEIVKELNSLATSFSLKHISTSTALANRLIFWFRSADFCSGDLRAANRIPSRGPSSHPRNARTAVV